MKGLLLTYLVAYGGAAAALCDPFYGLLAYVCLAILRPEFLWFWEVPPGNYSRVVGITLVAGWVLHGALRQDRAVPLFAFGRARGVALALVAAWGWSVLSAAQAPDQERAWAFVELLFKIVLPFAIGLCLIDSVARLKLLAWTILLSEGYVALEMNLSYFGGYNRLFFDGAGGVDNNSAAIAMVTCLGLAFFFGLYAGRWWQRGLAFGCAALLGHAVLFSFSRGGMLGMIVTAGVAFLLIRKRPAHYLALAGAVLAGLMLSGPEVRRRFLTVFAGGAARDASAQSRLDLWAACCDVMRRMPLLGAGPDHWPLLAESYGFDPGKEAHSLWLQWGAELGVPALAFLLLFYGLCVWRLWPLARGRDPAADPWQRYLAAMVIAALAGFAVSAQFVSMKVLELPYYVALLGAGTLKLASLSTPAAPRAGAPLTFVP